MGFVIPATSKPDTPPPEPKPYPRFEGVSGWGSQSSWAQNLQLPKEIHSADIENNFIFEHEKLLQNENNMILRRSHVETSANFKEGARNKQRR